MTSIAAAALAKSPLAGGEPESSLAALFSFHNKRNATGISVKGTSFIWDDNPNKTPVRISRKGHVLALIALRTNSADTANDRAGISNMHVELRLRNLGAASSMADARAAAHGPL